MPQTQRTSPGSSWSTQQLAEFLAAVTTCADSAQAIACTVQWVTEALEAEVAVVLTTDLIVESIGFARGAVPFDDLAAIVAGQSTNLTLRDCSPMHALAVPVEDSVLSLVVARTGAQEFQPYEVGLVRAMARTLAMALRALSTLEGERALRDEGERRAEENLRLVALLQERQEFLERLSRIQASISQRAPLPEVLDTIVRGAHELLGDEVVALRVLDEDDPTQTVLAASFGLSRAMYTALQRTPLTAGAGGLAILEDRLITDEDFEHSDYAPPILVHAQLRAAMAAPIRESGRPVASIVVATYRDDRNYSETEREMLMALAGHAGIALHDAKVVDQMRHLAYHDALTGLPNRALFFEHLERAVANARRTGATMAVVFLDIDRFKLVNDSLGHPIADRLLETVATRLRTSLRAADLAARLGGDEFAVLAENTSAQGAAALAETIHDALHEPYDLDGHELSVSTSIGVALDTGGSASAEALLRNADLAMYRAKVEGLDHHLVFEPAMHVAVSERVHLEGRLRRAVQQNEFVVHYQPIVKLTTGVAVGVEALVRWRQTDGTLVMPGEFISIAEEMGLIVPISRIVLCEAMRQTLTWQNARSSSRHLTLSVNLSARHLHQSDVVDDIVSALTTTGFDARDLILEITETALMHDTSVAGERLHQLRALGVRIALDDFGTGYSSLAYLRHFPIDVLKIDRSFVSDVAEGGDGTKVARAVIELGRTLNLETVAEGIEQPEQVATLVHLRCALGQGYHFARPLPARQMTAFLRAQRARAAAATVERPAALAG